jgi:hypothetical protein
MQPDLSQHPQVGPKTIYRAVRSRQAPLCAAVVGGRRDLRFLPE